MTQYLDKLDNHQGPADACYGPVLCAAQQERNIVLNKFSSWDKMTCTVYAKARANEAKRNNWACIKEQCIRSDDPLPISRQNLMRRY